MAKGNHITDGKVVGTLKHGVSIDPDVFGKMRLYVGKLSGPSAEHRFYELTFKEARKLGLALLLEAARGELNAERRLREEQAHEERLREAKKAERAAKRAARAGAARES